MLHFDDIRYAFRLLRRSPLFTLATVVVLSGGLGLSIFTFSFLYTAMVKPLPLSGGERIVRIEELRDGSTRGIDAADLTLMRTAIRTLTGVGAFTSQSYVLGEKENRRAFEATATDYNIFETTRTRPVLGRGLQSGDQLPGAEPVVVLSQRSWRAIFASDPAIVDRRILLNGTPTRVIGVMPEGYAFPVASEAWVPLSHDVVSTTTPGLFAYDLYARLADGVSAEQAQTELQQLLERARNSRPRGADTRLAPAAVAVRPFPIAQFDQQGPLIFTVLNLLATLILLLACVNVTNLLLARANERARETAVRLALGASRARLIMQSLWETVLLCVLGGALATAIAAWGLAAINSWAQRNMAENLAFWWIWRIDRAALVAAGVFVTVTIAVLGGVVAVRTTGTRFTALLREGARSGGKREGLVSRVLVITQVATVTVLMFFGVLSGIMAQRFAHLDPGYDPRNLLSSGLDVSAPQYQARSARDVLYQTVADGLAQSPTVERVLLRAPLAEINNESGAFQLADAGVVSPVALPRAHVQALLGSPATLGIRTLAGRGLENSDDERALPVAVVSKAMADRYWPGKSPIGQRVRLTGTGEEQWRTVVGVASNLFHGSPISRKRSAVAIYIPLRQTNSEWTVVLFRHRGDAIAAQAAFYQSIADADPRMPPPYVSTMEEILAKSAMMARSVTVLFAMCFGFALLLAVTGTYSLMARAIGRRVREVGIRRALGASDRSIVRLLLVQGSRQLGIGVLIAAPVMALVGVGFWHFFLISLGLSLGSAVLVASAIVSVVLLATYVPARRVLAIGPREAIGQDL